MSGNLIIAIAIIVISSLLLIISLFTIIRSLLRVYWFAEAKKYLEAEKWDDAVEFYTRIIKARKRDTINALSFHNRGTAYLGKSDFETALEDYNQSINSVKQLGLELRVNKLAHLGVLFYLSRSQLLYRLERFEEALNDLEIARNLLPRYKLAKQRYLEVSSYPFEDGVQAEYAVTLFACGEIEQAQAQWRDLQAKAPSLTSAELVGKEFFWSEAMVMKAKELEASFM